ncbi:Uncharacterised protein [Mycobacteroides abscessus subsp. abscessus]|nr:Uncharacterised protein [Mycobacteroides abscessus subsp. abscessus]SHQ79317.1 Uncharacterised protein [Mycobacteroides abscessus subsp. abscessus]SKL16664.1 Uncharacterised protein [Mycobacteroides abscessus subsp. abscessus]
MRLAGGRILDASLLIRDGPALAVEGHVGHRDTAIADRGQEQARLDGVGGIPMLELDGLDAVLPQHPGRSAVVGEADGLSARLPRLTWAGTEDFQLLPGQGFQMRLQRLVHEVRGLLVDDNRHVRQSDQPEEFGQRERRMLGAASPDDDHLAQLAAAQRGQRGVRDVGARKALDVSGEHPSDVQGHVSVTDDDRTFVVQVDAEVGVVGMRVDPRDHLGSGGIARQLDPRDVQTTVRGRTDGVDHRVVMRQQFLVGDVLAHLDVQEELEVGLCGHRVEQLGHPLGLLVVWGHPCTHQTIWSRQPFEHVDLHIRLGQQLVGGVHGRRARAHDSHLQRAGPAHRWRLNDRSQTGPRDFARVELGIDPQEGQLLFLEGRVRLDGIYRAGSNAGTAIDTCRGIDVQHLCLEEIRLVRRGVDAVHRACVNAGALVTARLGDDVRHQAGTALGESDAAASGAA